MTLFRPLLALILLSGVAHAATYKDPSGTFSATVPAGWQQGSYPGTAVVFAGKREGDFTSNINVIVQPVPAGMTQAQYHALNVKQIGQLITDGKILKNQAATLGGVKGNRLVYTGRQGQYKLYFIATYAVKGNRVYMVTATSRQGQEAKLAPVNDAFIKSFKVLK
ncbi:PsbP-related protein [Deinococcus aquaedulcis]|uniref:PsbP-related protein n=1 Tax=Deinococcus aquaedulcis TaxID=2840455 RepID=UPI001C82CF82|nr:DcrB-related protein [Deinococcus aquaedulcis]